MSVGALLRGAVVRRALLPALMLAALAAAVACGGGGDGDAAVRDSVALAGPPAEAHDSEPMAREVTAVQVAAFADSAPAQRLRDSLERAGWQALVRSVRAGDSLPPYRVRVAPTRDPAMAQLVAMGFLQQGWSVAIVADSATLRAPTVQSYRVNDGTAGISARVRWLLSPDGSAMTVVEDPRSVEDDPLPDGFIHVAEGGAVLQRDSVWDVAPSPDWRRVAYGKAYIIPVAGRDSVAVRQWAAVAGSTNMEVSVVRRGAFPVSGMSHSLGFAQPVIEPTHPDSQGRSRLLDQVRRPVPVSGGWRVRWTADGRTLAVGLAPTERVADDSPPSGWLAVDADDYLLRGPLPEGSGLQPGWVSGPVITLDSAARPPLDRRRVTVSGGRVESEGGWVVIQAARSGGARRVIGPGALLAATRSGEFVAALAPNPFTGTGEPALRAVVYRLVDTASAGK